MTESQSNDPSRGNPSQGLRIFFGMDLTGSSSFKHKYPPTQSNERTGIKSWPEVFSEFFNHARSQFRSNGLAIYDQYGTPFYALKLWKMLGDEILFHSLLDSAQQAYWQIYAFSRTINDIDEYMSGYGLSIKGYCWTAGFPIRNRQIDISDISPYVRTSPDGNEWRPFIRSTDFIGMEIDQGFRLGQFAEPGRLTLSPDAAYVCALGKNEAQARLDRESANPFNSQKRTTVLPFRICHVGWRKLKGIYRDLPYPILWLEFLEKSKDRIHRRTFDSVESEFVRTYLGSDNLLSLDEYMKFFSRYSQDLNRSGVEHITPYISPQGMAPQDIPKYGKDDLRILETRGGDD